MATSILLSLLAASCSFFDDGIIDEPVNQGQTVTSVTLQRSSMEVKVGQMVPLGLAIAPASAKGSPVTWSYDKDIISIQEISAGAVITGLEEG